MPRAHFSLLTFALLATLASPALATDVLLPRNDKTDATKTGKAFGKDAATALPVVAMAVRPIPETPPAPPPPTPKLTGGGELGFAAASGNTNTESFNGRLDLTYTDGGAWRHSASLFGLHSRSEYARTQDDGSLVRDTRTTANRYTVNANSAYLMDDRGTINTALRHEEDDFGTYSRQQSLSLSYGNRVIKNERAHLDLQVGPGYRRAYDTVDGRTESSLIGRGLIDMRYALTENTEIVNKLLVESGEYNTFAQNDLGVSVTMNSHLALKAGWQARHNSDVAEDIKKTDTLTTMNVVYRFK
ncbi:putative salt-induced outer membrane protein [Pseudoxanthomonas sp. CF385]|nr:putative salt-induced outer membrane protein [Pseudoxanthomonas sp. CF385]